MENKLPPEWEKLRQQFERMEREIEDAMVWDIGHYRITMWSKKVRVMKW